MGVIPGGPRRARSRGGRLRRRARAAPPARRGNSGSGDLFAQNVRFRLAESLADRAELEPEDAESRPARKREALEALEPVPSEPSLQGFARLLRGELLTRLGQADQALPEVDAAAKAMPPPPARDVLEARIAALIGLGRFDDAPKAVASSPVEGNVNCRLSVRVRLARRASNWNTPNVVVFDDIFIDENVYSGLAVEPDHRQSLHELILGTQGVALNRNLQALVGRIEEHNRALRTKADAIPTTDRGVLNVDDFCALRPRADIDDAIGAATRALAAALEQSRFAMLNLSIGWHCQILTQRPLPRSLCVIPRPRRGGSGAGSGPSREYWLQW